MASYYYSGELQKWVKQCSCCKEITEGTSDRSESIPIFSQMFADAGPSSGAGDGFQSRCWYCNASKRRQLGVTRPMIEDMMRRQDGKCAICDRSLSIARNALPVDKANVDHDETTGRVRNLLCGNCNRGIGLFLHDPDTLKLAADYCDRHSKVIPFKDGTND